MSSPHDTITDMINENKSLKQQLAVCKILVMLISLLSLITLKGF